MIAGATLFFVVITFLAAVGGLIAAQQILNVLRIMLEIMKSVLEKQEEILSVCSNLKKPYWEN